VKRNRLAEAQEILMRAQVLEPSAGRLPARLAGYLAWMEKCPEARQYANRALSLTPKYRHALWALALCAELDGKNTEAETRYRELMQVSGAEQRSQAGLGHLLARTGGKAEARQIAAELTSIIRRGRRREVFAALVHTGLGANDAALTLLEQAWTMRDPNLLHLHLEPRFRVLGKEPRFQALLAKLVALR
jgi:tetratricopeptide (TPR) repeat protein